MKSQSHCPISGTTERGEGPLTPTLPAVSVSAVPEILGNATSLRVREGPSLRLVCVVDSNPPARISWARGSLTLSASPPSHPEVLELPRVLTGDEGEFTCRAQHALGSQHISLRVSLQSECPGAARGGPPPPTGKRVPPTTTAGRAGGGVGGRGHVGSSIR